MARTDVNRLTDETVASAQPGVGGKTVVLCDGGGLLLQVSTGKYGQICKSWIFRYTTPDGTTKISAAGRKYRAERFMGLGSLHTVGLTEAREMARDARLKVKQGKDPLDERNKSNPYGKTFDQAAFAYACSYGDEHWGPAHTKRWLDLWKGYISPIIGSIDLYDIGAREIKIVIEGVRKARCLRRAEDVRGMIEAVFDYAGINDNNHSRWNDKMKNTGKIRPSKNFSFDLIKE
jgi:hypothetical protein